MSHMHDYRYQIRKAFLANNGRHKAGHLRWKPVDDRVLQFVIECGSFGAQPVSGRGWQCRLQVYSEFEFFPDAVWQHLASAHAPEAYWTTIESKQRLAASDANASPQFLCGVRIATKESSCGLAAFLRRVEPPWRKDVWTRWCEATDLYGRGPTPQQRREAALRLKLAVKQEPATPVVAWLEQNRIIPEWRTT